MGRWEFLQLAKSGPRRLRREERSQSLSPSFICSLRRLPALRKLEAFGNGRKPYVASCKWDKSRGTLINPDWLIFRLTMSAPICLSKKKKKKDKTKMALEFSSCVFCCSALVSARRCILDRTQEHSQPKKSDTMQISIMSDFF